MNLATRKISFIPTVYELSLYIVFIKDKNIFPYPIYNERDFYIVDEIFLNNSIGAYIIRLKDGKIYDNLEDFYRDV